MSKYWGATWIAADQVFAGKVVIFALRTDADFALLNSCFHTEWAEKTASRLKEDPSYSLANTFETLPFPLIMVSSRGGIQLSALDQALLTHLNVTGSACHTHRSSVMEARREGLTTTYNRLHTPHEVSRDITALRALHVEMDNAIAAAYGWTDLDFGHGFHETRQGIRYTISEPARRSVLDRLLALNHDHYAREQAAALVTPRPRPKARKSAPDQAGLF